MSSTELPSIAENPDGLHKKYHIERMDGKPLHPETVFFMLRLDEHGSDPIHRAACIKSVLKYAEEIKDHLPQLSQDLINRYSG